MEILKWLKSFPIVSDFKILEYKIFPSGIYIKIKVLLVNKTELYIREYSDQLERNYSYHWQSEDEKLIIRWDNAPHYPKLFNSPHHKHSSNKIESSNEMTVEDILKVISKQIEIKEH